VSICDLYKLRQNADKYRSLLGEIYEFFSEGFDTTDLVRAKARLRLRCKKITLEYGHLGGQRAFEYRQYQPSRQSLIFAQFISPRQRRLASAGLWWWRHDLPSQSTEGDQNGQENAKIEGGPQQQGAAEGWCRTEIDHIQAACRI
jgi:hypothetical protein